MSTISAYFENNTPFFLNKLFIKPFALELTDTEKLVKIEVDSKTSLITFTYSSPGNCAVYNRGVNDKEKLAQFIRVLTFHNAVSTALNHTSVELAETVTMHLLDGIVCGVYSIVPVIDKAIIESLEDDELIMAFGQTKMLQYTTDGVTCARGFMEQYRLELGVPTADERPYVYDVLIAGSNVSFNQALTLDHNILTKDEENNPLQPIATGSVNYSSTGNVKIVRRAADRCWIKENNVEVCYDLLGRCPAV